MCSLLLENSSHSYNFGYLSGRASSVNWRWTHLERGVLSGNEPPKALFLPVEESREHGR